MWNLWVAFLCPFSYYFAQVDGSIGFLVGYFCDDVLGWDFLSSFFFLGTLMRFGGLGFDFFTLKVFFLFVSTYESWDLLCWVMFLVFFGFFWFWGLGGGSGRDFSLRFVTRFFIEWVGCVRGIDSRDEVGFQLLSRWRYFQHNSLGGRSDFMSTTMRVTIQGEKAFELKVHP